MATCRATRKICFLSTTHGRLPSPSYKHSFLMTQVLVTCCRRLAGQNTCTFAETIHTSNLYGEYVNITRAQSAFHSLLVFGVNCDLSLQLSTRDHKPLPGRQSSPFVLHFLLGQRSKERNLSSWYVGWKFGQFPCRFHRLRSRPGQQEPSALELLQTHSKS